MINYYGIATRKEIELFTGEAIETIYGIPSRIGEHLNPEYMKRFDMMIETYCAETLFGEMPDTDDKQGMGLSQIDRIKYDDIIKYTKHRDVVWNAWQIDINLVTFESLRYDWHAQVIFTILGFRRIIETIPDTRQKRASYWVRNWNVCGAGKEKDYLARCERILV